LGKEACGKLTCFKYQVIDSTAPATTQYLWFDTKDYMMQRWSFKDANSSSDMVFTYQAVTIKAPSTVHDFDANSQADMQAAQAAAAAAAAAASAGSDTDTTE
jgi:outer membrane lipoprotein-sorting protein